MSTPIRRGIYGKLAGDTTLNGLLGTPPSGYAKNIYHQQAPEGAGFPFVVFQKQSGTPDYALQNTSEKTSAYENDLWLIKAVGKDTTADPAEAVQARLIVLL